MSKNNDKIDINNRLKHLQHLIVELEEEASLSELGKLLDEGVDPQDLLACCMEGMRLIGIRFEEGTYFIAALIMAGEIMRLATEMLSPHLVFQGAGQGGGKVMLGTIQGDIHDLGKNLFALLLKCHGIDVVDIGVDAPVKVFQEKAQNFKPDIIGISCVLTNSIENLKSAVNQLQRNFPDIPIVVGGTCMDETMAEFVGARFWATDAAEGLKICQTLLHEKKEK